MVNSIAATTVPSADKRQPAANAPLQSTRVKELSSREGVSKF
jgi:hypothetical protein